MSRRVCPQLRIRHLLSNCALRMEEKVGIDNLYSLFSILTFLKTIPFTCSTGPHNLKALTAVKGLSLYWSFASWFTIFIWAVYTGFQWFQFLEKSLGETVFNFVWFKGICYACTLHLFIIHNREDLENFIRRFQRYCYKRHDNGKTLRREFISGNSIA